MWTSFLSLIIALCASVIGGICGVGGGVLMKPLLDITGIASVSTASFLSGVTVLAMTGYSTAKDLSSKTKDIEIRTVLPLALGAAAGGVIGKYLFEIIKAGLPYADKVGAVQAILLAFVCLGTMLYTINKERIASLHVQSRVVSAIIGMLLGTMSSFLGIGGGPIDLVVLFFFFSMETKIAVQNSLFIILFSQAFSLIYTLAAGRVPEFKPLSLILMIAGGILGGIIGKRTGKKLSGKATDKLFIGLLAVIILICVYNAVNYLR